ncbi:MULTISPECIES: transposase [Bacillaceae]|uniref:Transposase n=1 Tax=Evansella alkalicola TaxID=745819 RepID=A0ABS6JWP1_9BACI|nr:MULTISPECIES: helix-turn-helix domain-containing protein [Bacillaceae]MBU9723005.1 transposase [Bacillus alkalicola]
MSKGPFEEVKKKYVRMALESGNTSFIARKVGVAPKTLQTWVKLYRDEIESDMEEEGVLPLSENSTQSDLQAKYDHAMKLLGEKELEVALLREQVKKNLKG